MGRGGNTVEIKSTAKWDGPKLVITSKRPGQDGAMVETTATWSVTGGVLTIENAGRTRSLEDRPTRRPRRSYEARS